MTPGTTFRQCSATRRGVAAIWALVVLSVLTVVMALATWQTLAGHRQAERRQYQLQAEWLARSGVELAAARLLAAADYKGETVELMERGQVRITVQAEDKVPGMFRITVEARYPAEEKGVVLRTASRTFRRVTEKGRVRLEVMKQADAKPDRGK